MRMQTIRSAVDLPQVCVRWRQQRDEKKKSESKKGAHFRLSAGGTDFLRRACALLYAHITVIIATFEKLERARQ